MSTPGAGVRRLLLDQVPGERRGVVLLDGLPERLLIVREGEPARAELGAQFVGRLGKAAGGRSFVDLPVGPSGMARLSDTHLPEGAAVAVTVVAEAHGGKGPRLTIMGGQDGPPRLLALAPSLRERLQALAPDVAVEGGDTARDAADLAQEAALATEHRFRAGLTLHIEPTRALTAIDVDLAAGEGAGERRLREANLSAIRHAVRLLRLKALGGVAAIDLVGFPDPQTRGLYRAEAARALEPDGAEALAAAPDRFGLLHVSRSRRERPVAEALLDADGAASARTTAQRLVRELLREGRADPGARLVALAPADVAQALRARLAELGPRFDVREVAMARDAAHIGRA